MSGMTWIDFGQLSLFVSRRADEVLTRWGKMIRPRGGRLEVSEFVECHQVSHIRDILQAQAILCAPTPVPILDRAFLVGYYAFGRGPEEISAITGVPVEDTYAVMQRAVSAFAAELARSDVQRMAGAVPALPECPEGTPA